MMSTILQNITDVLVGTTTDGVADNNGIVNWVTTVVNMITSNPLILLFVIMSVALIAIGVVKRLLQL